MYNGIYSAIKKEILSFAAVWMDIDTITLTEGSQRERRTLYNIVHMWNLQIIQMNLYTEPKHKHRNQTYSYQRGKGRRMDK